MDSERLQRIEALYHEALALPAEERAGFVAENYFGAFLNVLTTLPSGWPWIATYARTT
jgi:hypothetical protein